MVCSVFAKISNKMDLNELVMSLVESPTSIENVCELPMLPCEPINVTINDDVPAKKVRKKRATKPPSEQKKVPKIKAKIKSAIQKVKKIVKIPRKVKMSAVNKSCDVLFETPRPHLVLQNIHSLNESGTKHISIGYDADNSFRVAIILSSTQSYVYLTVSDWLSFMLNFFAITNYLRKQNTEDNGNAFHTSNNIKVSKESVGEQCLIYLENMPRTRLNNGVFLDIKEFDRCMMLDVFIRQSVKEMQVNPSLIDDYYNWYVYYCHSLQKSALEEKEYFVPFGNPLTFDSSRLFQEIPIYCEEKLNIDLSNALESCE